MANDPQSGAPARVPAGEPRAEAPALLPRDRTWDVHQAAAFLGRSTSWVYKAAERGELPRARGFGWGLKFIPAELEAFVRGDPRPVAAVLPIKRKGGGT